MYVPGLGTVAAVVGLLCTLDVCLSAPVLALHAPGPEVVPDSVTTVQPLKLLSEKLSDSRGVPGGSITTVMVLEPNPFMLSRALAVIVCVPTESVLMLSCPVEPSAPSMLEDQLMRLVSVPSSTSVAVALKVMRSPE